MIRKYLYLAPLLFLSVSPLASHAQSVAATPASATSPQVLPTVEVQAAADGYSVPTATSALKTDIPIFETPQAVSVVPHELMKDQGSQTIEDVVRNVAGVAAGGYYREWDFYRIRGFDVSYNASYLDGLLTDGAPGEEVWGLDRVEVIKGPASTLYGGGPLGGFVNLVSKHPKPDNFGEIEITGGSDAYYQAALDVNAFLNKSQTIYGRLNLVYRNEGSFIDYINDERIYVAPSITWEIDPNTTLTFLSSYKMDRMNLAFALPAVGTVLPNPNGNIPLNRFIGNPAHPNDEYERSIRLGYEFKHRFSDFITLRQNFRYSWLYASSFNLSYPSELLPDDRTDVLQGYEAAGHYKNLRVDTAVDATFDTGPIKHTMTAGLDFRNTRSGYLMRDGDYISLDVFNPNYAALPAYQYGSQYTDYENESDIGFYYQEHAKIDKFTFTAGVRYDHSFDFMTSTSANAVTPKVGITYEFVPGVAAYANYSRSFLPQWSFTDQFGNPVQPETGENWEVGVKFNLLDGKLTGMIAAYQLTRQNVATSNLATPDPFDSIVSGEQRSRGIEFETQAELAPGLKLTAAYSYVDGKVTKDNDIPVGSLLPGVPKNSTSIWLKYMFPDGSLHGFGLGLGGHYYSSQAGDTTFVDPFTLPGYGILDAAIYYERERYSAQVNFGNILNKRYFPGAYDRNYVLPGRPFNVMASVTYKF